MMGEDLSELRFHRKRVSVHDDDTADILAMKCMDVIRTSRYDYETFCNEQLCKHQTGPNRIPDMRLSVRDLRPQLRRLSVSQLHQALKAEHNTRKRKNRGPRPGLVQYIKGIIQSHEQQQKIREI